MGAALVVANHRSTEASSVGAELQTAEVLRIQKYGMSGKWFPILLFRLRPASVGRFSDGLARDLPTATRHTTRGVSAPYGSGLARLAEGGGTPARIRRKLTIAGRDYGKGEGGDISVLHGGGIPVSDPSLRSQRGRGPPALWNPLPLRAFPPPPLVSIPICVGSIAGVSSQRSLSPAREAAFRVGPLGDASSARGGAGGPEARRRRRPTAGVGRGRSRRPPRGGRIGEEPTWPA